MNWGNKISFTVTAQPNQWVNNGFGTNHYDYIPNLKVTFTPSAL